MNSENRTEKMIKKKRRRKKNYLLRLFVIISICVGLYFVSHIEYFDVNGIAVVGNKEISDEEIMKLSELKPGNSIFDVHPFFTERRIKKNLYIEDVNVNRKLPNKIEIHVTERSGKAQFVKEIKKGKDTKYKYIITDNEGQILEISDELRKATLVKNVTIQEAELKKDIEVKEKSNYDKAMEMIRITEENDLYFKMVEVDKNNVRAYIYDELMCKGTYDNVIKSIESGALKTVIYDLYQKGTESGIINISGNNYCSFTP